MNSPRFHRNSPQTAKVNTSDRRRSLNPTTARGFPMSDEQTERELAAYKRALAEAPQQAMHCSSGGIVFWINKRVAELLACKAAKRSGK
jgi:hypothetical protein